MVTLNERLESARAEVAAIEREIAQATCIQIGSCDMQSVGGANCGCPDGQCSVPVLTCTRCGACDNGDNADAINARAACAASRDIPEDAYWSIEHNNFYSIDGNKGRGLHFFSYWRSRRAEFPQCDCQMVPTHISNDCPIHG